MNFVVEESLLFASIAKYKTKSHANEWTHHLGKPRKLTYKSIG